MSQTVKSVMVLAMVAGLWTGVHVRAQAPKEVPNLSGVWKLNVAASTNPDGPAPAAPARGARGGGGDAGGGGDQGSGGGDEGGGGGSRVRSAEGGELGADEMRRFNASKALFFKAPPMMGIQSTATDFKIILDPEKNAGYQHKLDGKKQTLPTPAGPADFKAKWDGMKLRREAETKESLHVVEDYSLSSDGRQLIVTVKADSRMVRAVQTGDIKRIYDRQQ
jgi:hypothetical protein